MEDQHNRNLQSQISELMAQCIVSFRKSCSDGNSYYRCVGNAYLEHCIRTGTLNEFYCKIHDGSDFFGSQDQLQHEVKFQVLLQLYKLCAKSDQIEQMRGMQSLAQERQFDLLLIRLMRCIACNGLQQLKNHPDIEPYLMDDQLRQLIVLVNKLDNEASGIIFRIMAIVLKVRIVHHEFIPEESKMNITVFRPLEIVPPQCAIHLLYRRGNYEILNTSTEMAADAYNYEQSSFGPHRFAEPPLQPIQLPVVVEQTQEIAEPLDHPTDGRLFRCALYTSLCSFNCFTKKADRYSIQGLLSYQHGCQRFVILSNSTIFLAGGQVSSNSIAQCYEINIATWKC